MNPLLSNPALAVGYMPSQSQTPLETRFPKPSCDGEYHLFNAAPPSNPNPLPLPGYLPIEEVLLRVVGNRLWTPHPQSTPYQPPLPGFPSDAVLSIVFSSLSSSAKNT
ncbi:hypothetical protein [Chlamydia pecorum]|uniref:hypothetical protein n=1 Tax=Chlamydia pecorum TaxID=85991 RepID=UPI0007AFBDFF|nr:hypothetical protein [Chlamydia pecorum]KZN27069.1 hypothetical protein cpL71_0927 [Chlamydia pecorum]